MNLYILKNANSVLIALCPVKDHGSALLKAALYYCTVLLNTDIT